jgi:hypothetical protein
LALGLWALLLVGGTFGTVVDFQDVHIKALAAEFKLDLAASAAPNWTPGPDDWRPGGQVTDLPLDPGLDSRPGATVAARFAVRATSPASLLLSAVDPDPQGDAVDSATGLPEELFGQLRIALSEAGQVLYDGPVAELRERPLPDGPLLRVFDARVYLPADLDPAYAIARSRLQLIVKGTSS